VKECLASLALPFTAKKVGVPLQTIGWTAEMIEFPREYARKWGESEGVVVEDELRIDWGVIGATCFKIFEKRGFVDLVFDLIRMTAKRKDLSEEVGQRVSYLVHLINFVAGFDHVLDKMVNEEVFSLLFDIFSHLSNAHCGLGIFIILEKLFNSNKPAISLQINSIKGFREAMFRTWDTDEFSSDIAMSNACRNFLRSIGEWEEKNSKENQDASKGADG